MVPKLLKLLRYFKSHSSSYLLRKLWLRKKGLTSINHIITHRHLHRICYWQCSQKHLRCRLLISNSAAQTFLVDAAYSDDGQSAFNKLLLVCVYVFPTGFSDLANWVELKAPRIIHIYRTEPVREPDFCKNLIASYM